MLLDLRPLDRDQRYELLRLLQLRSGSALVPAIEFRGTFHAMM